MKGNTRLPKHGWKKFDQIVSALANAKLQTVGIVLFTAIAVIIVILTSNSIDSYSSGDYMSKEYCEVESATPQDVYACFMAHCTFDITLCSEACPFGFVKDENGCVKECLCAKEGVFEGDIYFDEIELPELIENYGYASDQDFAVFVGSATSSDSKLWNQDIVGGNYIVKYALMDDLKDETIKKIRKGIAQYDGKCCIKFEEVPVDYGKMHIAFRDAEYCAAYVGRRHNSQGNSPIFLSSRCSVKNVQHEILHALGFNHEQSRPDRDSYVRILEENIIKDLKNNFEKLRLYEVRDLNSEYDVKSIMHYSAYAFSKNWRPTIESLSGESVAGYVFSEKDLSELNALYKCPKVAGETTMQWGQWGSWSRCDETCGPGKKARYRQCQTNTNKDGQYCKGSSTEKAKCKVQSCPGEWGEWTSDGPCSQTCGRGTRWMVRSCNNYNVGCEGRSLKITECNRGSCKQTAVWTAWSNWSQCRASCGKATATRVRFCQDYRGTKYKTCDFRKTDNHEESKSCNLPSCESVSQIWSSWSQCSATCEGYRRRKCSGGRCPSNEEVEKCATRPCKEPDIFAKTRESLNVEKVCNAAFTMENWIFGDFNGDQRVDIVCLDAYGVFQLSYGSESGFNKVWSGVFERCGGGVLLEGDVNRDGKSDLICKSKKERLLLVKYAVHNKFHEDVIEGGEFCAKNSMGLNVVTMVGETGLLCHSPNDHIVEIRITGG